MFMVGPIMKYSGPPLGPWWGLHGWGRPRCACCGRPEPEPRPRGSDAPVLGGQRRRPRIVAGLHMPQRTASESQKVTRSPAPGRDRITRRRWTTEEDAELDQLTQRHLTERGGIDFAAVVSRMSQGDRTLASLQQRSVILSRRRSRGGGRSLSPTTGSRRRSRAAGTTVVAPLRFGHQYALSPAQVKFRARGQRFLVVGYANYLALAVLAVLTLGEPADPKLGAINLATQQQHAVMTIGAMLLTCFWQYESLLGDPPPEPTDNSWSFLSKCPVHKFIFLTVCVAVLT